MIPIIATNYPYTANGRGGLADAISCTVTHEVNGQYDLVMKYPITGQNYSEIKPKSVIMAAPDNMTSAQAFRIYRVTKPLNGVVTVYCNHICYDMSGTIVEPFTETNLTTAIANLTTYCTPATSFTFATTKTVATQMKLSEPRELWRLLGGSAGSFLDIYGGEWDFDNMTATLRTRLGSDRGVEIRYGKNMTGFEQDLTVAPTYAGVYPYWYDESSGTLVTLPEDYVTTGSSLSDRILLLDCSGDFETAPTEAQLRTRATNYANNNDVGDAKTSWKVNMALIQQDPQYAGFGVLETVALGDTVKVICTPLNITASARVVKTQWDVLGDKYLTVTIGRVKQNLAKIVVDEQRSSDAKITAVKSALEKAIDSATDFITNGEGYMRFIYNANDELQEIVSLDNPDISLASSVWRWNNGGFGHSATGYGGPYTTAITQNGAIVADFITTGTLNAQRVQTGILTDALNHNSWNLDTGALTITDGSLNVQTTSSSYDVIKLVYSTSSANLSPGALQMVSSGGTGYYGPATIMLTNKADTRPGNHFYADMFGQIQLRTEESRNIQANLYVYDEGNYSARLYPYSLTFNYYSKTAGSFSANPYAGQDAHGTISLRNGVQDKEVVLIGDNTYCGRVQLTNVADAAYTFWNPTALDFYNASGTKTATYPADPSTLLTGNSLRLASLSDVASDFVSSSGTAKTYTLENGTYLVTTARVNNSSTAQDGLWIISAYSSGTSHMTAILTPSGTTSVIISGATLTVTTGSNNVRISVIRLT